MQSLPAEDNIIKDCWSPQSPKLWVSEVEMSAVGIFNGDGFQGPPDFFFFLMKCHRQWNTSCFQV